MKRTTLNPTRPAAILGLALALCLALSAHAQTATRFLGAITAINGTTITVKTDAGESHQVTVPADAVLKRVEPGQKDLSSAATIALTDLAVGDRVLVRLNADGSAAQQIIAIKAADVAQKQQQDREDWQRHGVAGLVKSVDTTGGTITITSGAGATAKTILVKTTSTTVLKRYAPGSVRFDDAQKAPITAIHVGDQLRARGNKAASDAPTVNTKPDGNANAIDMKDSAAGNEITAAEVISGSFRNLSGLIASIDSAASTVTLKDLATKAQVTIHVGPDAQMHRIPDQMAQQLAARLKGGAAAPAGAQRSNNANTGAQSGNGRNQGGGDSSQLLSRTPVIQLSDLKKGDAIMVVATEGTTDVNAITLVAGVEPLLEAPAASNLLSSWSMSSGEGGGAAAQ